MNVSLNWLKEFLPIHQSPLELSETLTNLGLAVDAHSDYESIPGSLAGVVVGKIITCVKHPNADRLSLTQVEVGTSTPLSIVCGAPNVASGQTVLVATMGSILHTSKGEKLEIKKGKIRGEISEGMICAGDELGLSDDHSGILVLPDHWPVGTPASEVFPVYNDTIFEVDLTPNRSDATSHLGVARDLAAYYKVNQPGFTFDVVTPQDDLTAKIDQNLAVAVTVEDPTACPRYSGISIGGVQISASPEWLQNRLKAIGVRPVNNVVDITNFILHAYGQPLHAFDLDKISEDDQRIASIRVKKLPAGTKFVTLDGVERSLHQDDLMICNGVSQPICIAGVFGGLHSGISTSTQNIFLESAHFAASTIRRTSMRHVLRTDAATRYEKGTDPNITITALHAAAKMIIELCGGYIASEGVDVYPQPIVPAEITIDFARVRKVIGQQLSDDQIVSILAALEMQPEQSGEKVRVKVPTNKADVKRDIDVIEEILRIHGYNAVPMPAKMEVSFANSSESSNKQHLKEEIAALLCHLGFHEIMGLSLMESRVIKSSGYVGDGMVYIQNTSNVHLDIMRPELLRSGLSTLQYNQNRQQTDLKLYEFGKSYHTNSSAHWPFIEKEFLAVFVTGLVEAPHWNVKEIKQGYLYLKGLAHQLLAKWGITDYEESSSDHDDFIEARQIIVHNKALILFGEVSDGLAKSYDIRNPIYYLQVDWDILWSLLRSQKLVKISVPGKYPSVRRDLAIVVDRSMNWHQIESVLHGQKVAHLQSFDLFDVFEHEERVGKDKKSLAISLIFGSPSQTLKDEDLEKSMRLIQDRLREQIGAVVR